jgi:8-oxo-dGTP diphosphatase
MLVTGRDPEYPDDRQVILQSSWLPIEGLNDYHLYPPFLPEFITKGVLQGFDTLPTVFYDSRL